MQALRTFPEKKFNWSFDLYTVHITYHTCQEEPGTQLMHPNWWPSKKDHLSSAQIPQFFPSDEQNRWQPQKLQGEHIAAGQGSWSFFLYQKGVVVLYEIMQRKRFRECPRKCGKNVQKHSAISGLLTLFIWYSD